MKLKDKVALITGAGPGIGSAIATLSTQQGARVIANDVNEKGARENVEKLGAARSGARATQAGVADRSPVKALFAVVRREFGSLDVLVYYAGFGSAGTSTSGSRQAPRVVRHR